MGNKYTVTFCRNGNCGFKFDWGTEHLLVALWWLIKLGIKYPIVDFKIRRGYVPCEKCDADWCDKAGKTEEADHDR